MQLFFLYGFSQMIKVRLKPEDKDFSIRPLKHNVIKLRGKALKIKESF